MSASKCFHRKLASSLQVLFFLWVTLNLQERAGCSIRCISKQKKEKETNKRIISTQSSLWHTCVLMTFRWNYTNKRCVEDTTPRSFITASVLLFLILLGIFGKSTPQHGTMLDPIQICTKHGLRVNLNSSWGYLPQIRLPLTSQWNMKYWQEIESCFFFFFYLTDNCNLRHLAVIA